MAYRLLIEVALFLMPFALFGLYRMVMADAAEAGRKTWPITSLFVAGGALALGFWVFLILREDRNPNRCFEPARFENGELIPGREYECDPDIESVGVPRSRGPAQPAPDPDG